MIPLLQIQTVIIFPKTSRILELLCCGKLTNTERNRSFLKIKNLFQMHDLGKSNCGKGNKIVVCLIWTKFDLLLFHQHRIDFINCKQIIITREPIFTICIQIGIVFYFWFNIRFFKGRFILLHFALSFLSLMGTVSLVIEVLLESGALLELGLFLKPSAGTFLVPMLFIGEDVTSKLEILIR